MTIRVTPKIIEALQAVWDRAEDDWLTYRNSGNGPTDFSDEGEWDEHRKREDNAIHLSKVFINALRESLR